MQKFPMTINGYNALNEELQRLKTVERRKVIQAISEARSHGDISENAEYDAAKEKQAFIEGRISDIEAKLSQAQVIDPKKIKDSGKITFGATVKLLDIESNETTSYQIVGDDEADIKKSKISVNSPVAKSLIGREVGQEITVRVPNGTREYEILDFEL